MSDRKPEQLRTLNAAAGGARHNPITLPRISLQEQNSGRDEAGLDRDAMSPKRIALWAVGVNEDGD